MTDFQTQIDTDSFDGKAPLYRLYAGQHQPQPAYIQMTEGGVISATYNANINCTSANVWHERTLQWSVPADTRGAVLRDFVKNAQPLFERVYAGHSVEWNGHNHVGKLDSDAQQAREEIEALVQDFFSDIDMRCDVVTAYDFITGHGNIHIDHVWPQGETLEQVVTRIQSDIDDAGDAVEVEGADNLEAEILAALEYEADNSPTRLSAHHWKALIDDGRYTEDQVREIIEDHDLEIEL